MSGIIAGLLPSVDSILGIRDTIGANTTLVYIITRTWSGTQGIGDGTPTDVAAQITPTPGIEEFAHDIRLLEGGAVQQGDILVTGISKNSYAAQSSIDCSSSSVAVEKFYQLGGSPNQRLYTVVNIKENYLTWDVLLRKRADNTRY